MATSCTCWQRSQSANPSSAGDVVGYSRTSSVRRPGTVSSGTRTHATNPALPISIAQTRSANSAASADSADSTMDCTTQTASLSGRLSGGCPQERYGIERGGLACSKQQCRAPEDHAPSGRLLDGLEAPSSNDVSGQPTAIFTPDRAPRQGHQGLLVAYQGDSGLVRLGCGARRDALLAAAR